MHAINELQSVCILLFISMSLYRVKNQKSHRRRKKINFTMRKMKNVKSSTFSPSTSSYLYFCLPIFHFPLLNNLFPFFFILFLIIVIINLQDFFIMFVGNNLFLVPRNKMKIYCDFMPYNKIYFLTVTGTFLRPANC